MKIKQLLKKYIVVKDINNNVHITIRGNFENIPINDTYDEHGIKVDIENGDEWFITAWNWTDGANWHTYFLDEEAPDSLTELRESEQLEILQQFESANFSDYERGLSSAETKDYTFIKSQFSSNPWIVSVI